MAIAIALRGFDDLGRSMGYFLYRFSAFYEKIRKKIYRVGFESFAKRSIEFRRLFDLFV